MILEKKKYCEIRKCMRPGDVIAFAGRGLTSRIIRWLTRSNVSHVGVVIQTNLLKGKLSNRDFFNQVVEATGSGVKFALLSGEAKFYNGELWWFPLSETAREKLCLKAFFDSLFTHAGKHYDFIQALRLGFRNLFRNLFKRNLSAEDSNTEDSNKKDSERFFCSELVASALRDGGVIDNIDPKTVTPIKLLRQSAIYAEHYVQFKGKKQKAIRGL